MPKARQYEPNITNVYCTNCGLAKYNNLTISIKKNLGNLHISKNKKLENYFCNKCNSNKNILMNHFHRDDEVDETFWKNWKQNIGINTSKTKTIKEIDEIYELGLKPLDENWLEYREIDDSI